MQHFTPEQIKKISKPALAAKHNCTDTYVRLVLNSKREDNSEKAKAIIESAKQVLQIFEQTPEN